MQKKLGLIKNRRVPEELLREPGILMVGSKENIMIHSSPKNQKLRIIKLNHILKHKRPFSPDKLML